jgi:hypothetical protein
MSQALIEERGEARWRRIGELLVLRGLLADSDVASALAEQKRSGRRLGQILVERGVISTATLDSALAEQATRLERERGFGAGLRDAIGVQREQSAQERRQRAPIGQVLRNQGYVSDEDINRALAEQAKNGKLIGEILVDKGVVSQPVLSRALETQADAAEAETERGLFTGLREAIARNEPPEPLGWGERE